MTAVILTIREMRIASSTELPQQVQTAIITFHHVSGIIFVFVNVIVCLLIFFEYDARGRGYRKYLLSLQTTSTLMDLFCNLYVPIIQVNCRAVYSDSPLAKYFGFSSFITLEVFLFVEVANFYFYCVYYRRNVVLPPESFFCFKGWRRNVIFLYLQGCAIVIGMGTYLVTIQQVQSIDQAIPPSVQWLGSKTAFFLIRESAQLYLGAACAIIYGSLFVFMIAAMLMQMLIEINRGMNHASLATQRYQKRAVNSIILQGLVPGLVYIVPILCELLIYLQTILLGFEAAVNETLVSTISALLLSVITTHAFVHSLTLLCCSPAYRRPFLTFLIWIIMKCRCSQPIQPVRRKSFLHIPHPPDDYE